MLRCGRENTAPIFDDTERVDMSGDEEAFALIVDMLGRAASPAPNFPPSELYSEGWMLRLLLESTQKGQGGMPFEFAESTRWYSEARLASPFLPRFRGDPHAEGYTNADGVVGHFAFVDDTQAGVSLEGSASQFVVVEAKMWSKLAAGTTKVSWFDQAARNVAAMAWTVHQSECEVKQLATLEFLVVAPRERLESEASFVEWTSRKSIATKVDRRITLYEKSEDQHRLRRFQHETFSPFLDAVGVRLLAWEDLIEQVTEPHRDSIWAFYEQCLRFNRPIGSTTL
jgi:hypothetical protein